MIWRASGENMITTDGASKMEALYPAAKILVELSISQDSAATDRTRTVSLSTLFFGRAFYFENLFFHYFIFFRK